MRLDDLSPIQISDWLQGWLDAAAGCALDRNGGDFYWKGFQRGLVSSGAAL